MADMAFVQVLNFRQPAWNLQDLLEQREREAGQRPALSPSQHEPPAGVHTSTSSPAAGSATTCAEAVVAPRGAWARFPSWS